jgi:hypothetical protein
VTMKRIDTGLGYQIQADQSGLTVINLLIKFS